MTQLLISAIVVNWNRSQDVEALVATLEPELSKYNSEIILVDNGSTQDDLAKLEKIKSSVPIDLIRLEKNFGPMYARNIGGLKSKSHYLLFLDSDGLLEPGSVSALLSRVNQDPSIGIIGGKIINYHSKELDVWIYPQDAKKNADRSFDAYSFSSGLALVNTQVFSEVGGFWSELFMAMEEVDLSLKYIRQGKKIIYEPGAVLLHKVNPEGRITSDQGWFFQCRNTLLIYKKYLPFPLNLVLVLLYIVVFFIKGLRLGFFSQVRKAIYEFLTTKFANASAKKLSYTQSFYFLKLFFKFKIKFSR
jgi:GT2 family glycosyltransferase